MFLIEQPVVLGCARGLYTGHLELSFMHKSSSSACLPPKVYGPWAKPKLSTSVAASPPNHNVLLTGALRLM